MGAVKNDLDRVFMDLRRQNKKALIAYLAAGYPKFREQEKLISALQEGGVDILELGVPFSDPIADGPTIQFASQESLKGGTTLTKILRWLGAARTKIRVPVVFMSYLNPLLTYGLQKFAKDARKAGVNGVIIPDLIHEEGESVKAVLNRHNLHLIYLVSPTTPPSRQRVIASKTSGFLYAVSVAGVTGARRKLPAQTKSWLKLLRRECSYPVCMGFGISGPDQIRHFRNAVDGFIVGSALIDLIRKNKPNRRGPHLRRFVGKLTRECSNGG